MSHDAIASTFDDWAQAGRDASMERGHGDVVEQVVGQMEIGFGQQILDLGCGNGWATRLLAKAAAGSGAVGVDVSPAMIARAEELHSYTIRARYEVSRFEELPFKDGQFDRAFSMEALYYAVDLERALAELARVLKSGAPVDLLVDYYSGRPGVEHWPAGVGLELQALVPDDWTAALARAGFEDAEHARLIDRRGPGDEAEFEPSKWYPSFEARRAFHDAGTLWIRGRRA